MTVTRLDSAETYYAPSRSGNGDGHLITSLDGAVSCSCPAPNGTCWAVRELIDDRRRSDDLVALTALAAVRRDQQILKNREAEAVASARANEVSWHRIAVALGRTTEGVRRKYRDATS